MKGWLELELIERIFLDSEIAGIKPNDTLNLLRDSVIKAIEVADIEQAMQNVKKLRSTDFHNYANDFACELIFRIRIQEGLCNQEKILVLRDSVKNDEDLRTEINDYLIRTINDSYTLKQAVSHGGVIYGWNFTTVVYQETMRRLCKSDFDKPGTADRVFHLLTHYLDFDFDAIRHTAKSETYEYGLWKFLDYCEQEVDAIKNIEELMGIRAMFHDRKLGIIDKNEEFELRCQSIFNQTIVKFIILFDKELKKSGPNKISAMRVKFLYDQLSLTDYDEGLRQRLIRIFKMRCKYEIEHATASRQTRGIINLFKDMVGDFSDLHAFYDSKLERDARLKNIRLVDSEMKVISSIDELIKYVSSNLDKNGDAGYRNNSEVVLAIICKAIDDEESIDNIDGIILGLHGGFRHRRYLSDYADRRKDEVRSKAIKSARNPAQIIAAMSLCLQGSGQMGKGYNKLITYYINKIRKAKTLGTISKLVEASKAHGHRTTPVEQAAAERVAELILAKLEVS
jgi:hypothetical protein